MRYRDEEPPNHGVDRFASTKFYLCMRYSQFDSAVLHGGANINTKGNEFMRTVARCGLIFSLFSLLTACGGGGDGSTSSSEPGASASSCAITQTQPLVAIALTGGAGTAQFSNAGSVLTYAGGLSGTLNLVQDSAAVAPLNKACLDATGQGSSMRTVMQSAGSLGISHALVSGVDQPVLLMDATALAANTSLAALQGTYTMLRYQHDTAGASAQTRMSYVTFTVDAAGNWSMCKNAPVCSPATATGSFSATPGSSQSFDLGSGGLVRAKAFMVGTGANRTLVAAEYDTGGGGVVRGIWFGVPQAAWNPVAGSYALNTTDGVQNPLTASASNLIVGSQNHALTADTPITGMATTTAANGNINYLISSPAGLLVTGNNEGNGMANGPGYLSFGVKP